MQLRRLSDFEVGQFVELLNLEQRSRQCSEIVVLSCWNLQLGARGSGANVLIGLKTVGTDCGTQEFTVSLAPINFLTVRCEA